MFGVKKPIISMLHLDALPGIRGFITAMLWSALWSMLVRTCMHCSDGGVDGIIVSMSSACPMSVRWVL